MGVGVGLEGYPPTKFYSGENVHFLTLSWVRTNLFSLSKGYV